MSHHLPDSLPDRQRRLALAGLSALSLAPFLPTRAIAGTAVHALPRLALVIGNGAYADSPLRNPVNDAAAIARELGQFGFATELLTDAGRASMQGAIDAFCARLAKQKAVGLFYFAGHGLQLDWRNYLVPVDARLAAAADVPRHTVELNTLFGGLAKVGNPLNVVVLDACRDNPFGSEHKTGRGLSQMDAPTGTFLAYATAPGNVAADGAGQHGLYTENILREMKVPEAKIEDVFKRVRLSVRRSSAGQQIPWESTSLEDDFYFRPPPNLRTRSEEELARLFEEESAAWRAADEGADAAPVLAYLQRYPSGNFSELAQMKLDRLLAKQGEKRIRLAEAQQNPFTKGTRAIGEFRVGDVYEFRIVDLLTGLKKAQYQQRITAVTENEVIYNDGVVITDPFGNVRKNSRGRWSAAQFYIGEYSLGKRWSARYSIHFAKGGEDVVERTFRVVALENITVPAGSFEAFRIESSGWVMQRGVSLESVYWVAPDRVNRFLAFEQREKNRAGKYITTDRTELIAYAPAA
ncbi:MAG: caspase family protein [Rhodocyclaceae bacterium]|nr:caspase family protein [Rhodocyclaceae bacterium]